MSRYSTFGSRRPCAALLVAGLALGWQACSHAALTMSTTRVVYEGERRSVSLVVANPSKDAYAVQAWVNTATDDTVSTVPFVVSPTLFRLDPAKQQQVQISALPHELPTDRESLFFYNLQEIPQLDPSHKNVLAIALRTRIKLFYRPAALKGGPAQQLNTLAWSVVRSNGKMQLAVDNPTPYYVTFSTLKLLSNGPAARVAAADMIAPRSRQLYAIAADNLQGPLQVEFTTINDYGGATQPLTVPVANAQ